jgi:uncharacterized Ntn-hydrolase superfamily protein
MVRSLPLLLLAACASAPAPAGEPVVATFSIVARDPETGELGVAVQSKFIAVGAVVPWAKAGVGAIATQSYANTTYGPRGLEMLAKDVAPDEVLKQLTADDPQRERRQAGLVDAKGRSATFTGQDCLAWAGGASEDNVCVQGNILAGEGVTTAMLKAFKEAKGDLGDRLLAALQAGQDAGGDARGKQSAALLVVHEGWGYGGFNDRYRDLRVDDHPEPIAELKRVYGVHRSIFRSPGK